MGARWAPFSLVQSPATRDGVLPPEWFRKIGSYKTSAARTYRVKPQDQYPPLN